MAYSGNAEFFFAVPLTPWLGNGRWLKTDLVMLKKNFDTFKRSSRAGENRGWMNNANLVG
jgi:hypothetical protein